MPPIPSKVITAEGSVLFTKQEILDGQNVWQSAGGQQMGTVWGHGAYVAPDWSADWLHRESVWLLDHWAQKQFGKAYKELDKPNQAALRAKLQAELRTNTYNPQTEELVVSSDRAEAIRAVASHYTQLFSDAPELAKLREAYAIPNDVLRDPERRHKMTGFFFWASWACAANRPGESISYTQNWPPEPLVANVPTGSSILWSVVSFVLLLAGVGALAWSAVSGYEPKFQRAGVNFLFVCLLIIVVGSMFGTWYGTRQRMGYEMNFWSSGQSTSAWRSWFYSRICHVD